MNAKVIRYLAATAAIAVTACVFVPNFFKGSQSGETRAQESSAIAPVLLSEVRPEDGAQKQEPAMLPSGQVLRRLNLSDAQLLKLKAIRENQKTETHATNKQLQQAQTELQTMMADSSPSARVREKFSQVQSLKQKLGQLHFERMLATREVLTPPQRSQLVEVLKQRRQGRRKSF
jgi:periplasmic protein CpxP/Spy